MTTGATLFANASIAVTYKMCANDVGSFQKMSVSWTFTILIGIIQTMIQAIFKPSVRTVIGSSTSKEEAVKELSLNRLFIVDRAAC